jgi:hypothetical protein
VAQMCIAHARRARTAAARFLAGIIGAAAQR